MLKDHLVYNDDIHEYSIQYDPKQKIIIPSVTQLLQYGHCIDMTGVDPRYAEDGKEIHTMTELVDQGIFVPDLVEGRVHAAIVGYEQFLLENDVVWDSTEEIIFNDILFYAGTKDRTGTVNGARSLVDLKSGNKYRWHILQLAAYYMCDNEFHELIDIYLGACDYKIHKWKTDEATDAENVIEYISKLYWYNHPMDYKRLLKLKEELG